jgi:hypothetical protein
VLDPRRDERVALAGADRVRGHADRLEARRAVAVHGRGGRRVGKAREQADHAGDVVRLLALGEPAAADQVLDVLGVERGVAVEQGVDDERAQVVGADPGQGALEGAADRGAD